MDKKNQPPKKRKPRVHTKPGGFEGITMNQFGELQSTCLLKKWTSSWTKVMSMTRSLLNGLRWWYEEGQVKKKKTKQSYAITLTSPSCWFLFLNRSGFTDSGEINFVKTSTYAEVMDFLKNIQSQTTNMHWLRWGKIQGQRNTVAIPANPLNELPAEAKATGKPIVYIQGNIHAGQGEGKEAVMMLMRDILRRSKYLLEQPNHPLAPIYNTDSNDKMEKVAESIAPGDGSGWK